ncbi:hypothetical protein B842_05605 [Corynebacterium humireducens NBRC 106098 = DSM 45392]|uniref:Uncharacterized protein n=1 Tax=Corynebacterium humireducens NBRC 106098 = DSM 45392 TaxID=1223515 RepID=A0A0B5D283_9CORY|nr:hypothetical protein [Corynebacterium humireducens]AJE32970.1 hypothetical protein B842_05605 [Corynebacterium humireducens NBRC 106098 = DSM 45392]
MRTLLLAAAALHAALFAITFLTSTLDVIVASVIAVILSLAMGAFALVRNGPVGTIWVATAAGLTALIGWASWLILWALDRGRTGAAVNVIGVLLPPASVVIFLVAALLPQTRDA